MSKALLLIIMGLVLSPAVNAQKKSDREKSGLIGPVKSVREEEAEYEFNNNGRLAESKRELSSVEEYNPAGQLLYRGAYTSGEKKSEILSQDTNRYDEGGRLVETTTIHSKYSNLPDKKIYIYDDHGNLKEKKGFDSNNNLLGSYSYLYDPEGNVVEERSSGTNKLYYSNWVQKRRYDANGRMIEESSYEEQDGRLVPYDFRLGYYKRVNLYDSQGRVVGTNYIGLDEGLYRTESTKFDDRGNEIESTTFNADGTINSRESYSYEFDRYGNAIKDTTYEWLTEDGKSFFRPKDVTYRTITYFKSSGQAPSSDNSASTNREDTDSEEYAVYAAVLNRYFENQSVRLVVVRKFTEGFRTDDPNQLRQLAPGSFLLGAVNQATLDDYISKNRNRQYELLEKGLLALKGKSALVTAREMTETFGRNCDQGWQVFYRRYPHAQGVTTLSRVGFDQARTQALVYRGTQSQCLAGAGHFIILEKSGGNWLIKRETMVWIS